MAASGAQWTGFACIQNTSDGRENTPFIYSFIIFLTHLATGECLLYFSVLSPKEMNISVWDF